MLERTCGRCGQRNRIPAARLVEPGACGACKAALPPPSTPWDVPDVATFDAVVRQAAAPVLVDFWAAWCGPCRMVAPQVAAAARTLAGRAAVLKVDTERLPELAQRYRVSGIPAFKVFVGGRPVVEQAGAVHAATLVGWVEQAAAT